MKTCRLKTAVLLVGISCILFAGSLGGCASTPPERPDNEKIKQDADKGMQDLKREENRGRDDY